MIRIEMGRADAELVYQAVWNAAFHATRTAPAPGIPMAERALNSLEEALKRAGYRVGLKESTGQEDLMIPGLAPKG